MIVVAHIIPDESRAIDAARLAAMLGLGLYITRKGKTVLAPQAKPGWQRIGAGIKDAYEQTDATAGCCDMDEIVGAA